MKKIFIKIKRNYLKLNKKQQRHVKKCLKRLDVKIFNSKPISFVEKRKHRFIFTGHTTFEAFAVCDLVIRMYYAYLMNESNSSLISKIMFDSCITEINHNENIFKMFYDSSHIIRKRR